MLKWDKFSEGYQIKDWIKDADYLISMDYSAYDATLSAEVIHQSFNVIREVLDIDEVMLRILDNLEDDYINSKLIL